MDWLLKNHNQMNVPKKIKYNQPRWGFSLGEGVFDLLSWLVGMVFSITASNKYLAIAGGFK